MKRIIKLEPVKKVPLKTGKLRVAAYCRVSTDTDDQKTSFDGQVKTYTEQITNNPDWILAGIYADEGITGTSAAKRPEFMRMIKDCEENRIDLILTKSISRFSRNTMDCISYVRHLNNLGVHIIFESNNIDTRAAFSEMLLTVLSAFAQEESRSISANTIWSIRKRFEEGIARWCKLYGYAKTEEGEYQIVPEQAAVVQKVFSLYEQGESIHDIITFMKKNRIPSPKGVSKWTSASVQSMLSNERYAGDILLQKYFVEDPLTHKMLRNHEGTTVQPWYIENHHTPIVSRKQFRRCQTIMELRRVNGKYKDKKTGTCNQYPLGDKLRCPCCGSILYQRTVPVQSIHSSGWVCEKGENACHSFIVRSFYVEAALLEAYEKLDTKRIQEKLDSPRFGEAARLALEIKQKHSAMQRVDYWWVDDMIDHIEFGAHSKPQRELARMAALGQAFNDDRTMRVFWKCGLLTTVKSGVASDRDHPANVAEHYNNWLIRQAEREKKKEAADRPVEAVRLEVVTA